MGSCKFSLLSYSPLFILTVSVHVSWQINNCFIDWLKTGWNSAHDTVVYCFEPKQKIN